MRVYDLLKRGLIAGTLVAGQMLNTANADSKPMDLEGKLHLPTIQEACTQLQEEEQPIRRIEPLRGERGYPQAQTTLLELGIKETQAVELTPQKRVNLKTESKGGETGKWSLGIGECTYWSGLASEKPLVSIEKLTGMNIRTFTDIKNDNYLSDGFVLLARDLNDKLAVYGSVGGAMTKIKNRKNHGLSIDLWREELYGALGLTWHPLGRPTETGLKGIKPIIDLEGGVTYSGAGVEFGLFGNKLFEENAHDIFFYLNPRIGVEVLVMKKNKDRKILSGKEMSVVMEVGRVFPSLNSAEYGGNNVAVYSRFRW